MKEIAIDHNLALQSTAVWIILLAAVLYLVVKVVRRRKNRSSGCEGCALADSCYKKGSKKGSKRASKKC